MIKNVVKAIMLSFCCVVMMHRVAYGFSRQLGPVFYTHRYYLLEGRLHFDYEKRNRKSDTTEQEKEIYGQEYDLYLKGDVYDPRLISFYSRFTLRKTNTTINRDFEADLTAKSYSLFASLFPTKRTPVTFMTWRDVFETSFDGYDRETTRDRYKLYWFWELRRFPLTTWSYELYRLDGKTERYRYGVKMEKDFDDTDILFNSYISRSPKQDRRRHTYGISFSHRKRVSDHVALTLKGSNRYSNTQTGEGATETANAIGRSTNMSANLRVSPSRNLTHTYRYDFYEFSRYEQEIGKDTQEEDTERHRFQVTTRYRISDKLQYAGTESVYYRKEQFDSSEITTTELRVSSRLLYRLSQNTTLGLGVHYDRKEIDAEDGKTVEEEYGLDGDAAFRHAFRYTRALSWADFASSYALGVGYKVRKRETDRERGEVDKGFRHFHDVDVQLKQINLYGFTRYASSLVRYHFSFVDDVGTEDDRTEHLLKASVKSRYFKRTTIRWDIQYKSVESPLIDESRKTVMNFDVNHTRRLYRGKLKLTLDHERNWDHVSGEDEIETEYKAEYFKPLTYRTVLLLELSRINKKTNDGPTRTRDFMSAEITHRLRAWRLRVKYSYAITEEFTDSRIFMSATRKFIRAWR